MNGACLNRFLRTLVCLSGAGLFTASVTQADIVIDAFTTNDLQQLYIEGPSGPATVTSVLQPAEVLGGAREVQLTRTSDTAALVSATVYNTVSYSSAQNAVGNALIVYNGGGAGLGNVDLTEGGTNNLIEVGVTSDLGANLIITVYTSPTQYSTATVPIPADPTFTPYYVSAYFTDISKAVHFTAAGSFGGANFGSVNAITAFIDGSTEAVDVKVDYFVATVDVPPQEPPTYTFKPLSPGYWKNHAWPVTGLTLGSQSYTRAELLKIMAKPGGDASTILAFQLIAAKLNIVSGADPAQISGLVSQADALLSQYGAKLPYRVKTSSAVGQQMTAIGATLSALWY